MAEKMIKIATPKEHPYSSHISKFAMFPSFRSPDDPKIGVRAASQPFLNPLIPNSAPDITLLSKTIGGPYRHEVLETTMNTRKKAVMWTGEHGFCDHTKPLKGDYQVFYPTPPKTVLPNPKLRDWDLSISERTSNMLKNLERTHWLTSYQMHHTAPNQGIASDAINQHRPREITAKCNEAPDPNQMDHSQSKYSSGSTEARSTEPYQEVLHKQKSESKRSAHKSRGKENCKVQFDVSPRQESASQSSQEANTAPIAGTERPLDLYNRPLSQEEMEVNKKKSLIELHVNDEPSSKIQYYKAGRNVSSISQSSVAKDLAGIESHVELSLRAASEQDKLAKGRELPHSISNPCILPRTPVMAGIRPVDRVGTVGREGAALCLLDLQNSFSKTKAHRNFNSSITRAAVNLRDNVVTGKKHDFYGINCYYLHG
ncbi:uncharacterized protein C7orf31 [Perca fluviatilis]|uniref:uncharacterized protein C7orf31 n=1 Tax=Perca fluviatilis TaxID=8168 RepID=UPI0019647C63|nr:uncharacterized protein C7orf31 [Perca fluviatilis]